MSTKLCLGYFLYSLDLELFDKIKNDLVFTDPVFTFLLIFQYLKKNKINSEHPFATLLSKKRVKNFGKKIINFAAVGDQQYLQFFRQIALFLGYNRALSKFSIDFCIT